MKIKTPIDAKFKKYHSQLLKHLRLKGLQPSTIDAYERAFKRIYTFFNGDIEHLSEDQILDYFDQFLLNNSWSGVKLDLYGLRFFTMHVLKKPWKDVPLIKSPKSVRIPDIVTVKQVQMILDATNKSSYKVFFFTLYSMGLRLSECINLKVSDIDGNRKRAHIRNAKGNKDRLVPISDLLLSILRKFWLTHKNPVYIFPNRKGGFKQARNANTPLNKSGVQQALRVVIKSTGLKKTLHRIA